MQELNSGDKGFMAKLIKNIFAVLLLMIITTLTTSVAIIAAIAYKLKESYVSYKKKDKSKWM